MLDQETDSGSLTAHTQLFFFAPSNTVEYVCTVYLQQRLFLVLGTQA